MIGHDVSGAFEPEVGQPGQHLAFARNRVGQDNVKGREPVAGDNQQMPFVYRVNIAYFALTDA
jgi:hypothetical protein